MLPDIEEIACKYYNSSQAMWSIHVCDIDNDNVENHGLFHISELRQAFHIFRKYESTNKKFNTIDQIKKKKFMSNIYYEYWNHSYIVIYVVSLSLGKLN